jgi:hypothetical protein
VVFRPEAEDEVLQTREWYEKRRSGLGKTFAQAVDEMVGIIENPLGFERAHGDIRRAVLSQFSYSVCYRLAHEEIVVLVVHGRQDQARWRSRS